MTRDCATVTLTGLELDLLGMTLTWYRDRELAPVLDNAVGDLLAKLARERAALLLDEAKGYAQ